jgi:hypothetical protein
MLFFFEDEFVNVCGKKNAGVSWGKPFLDNEKGFLVQAWQIFLLSFIDRFSASVG